MANVRLVEPRPATWCRSQVQRSYGFPTEIAPPSLWGAAAILIAMGSIGCGTQSSTLSLPTPSSPTQTKPVCAQSAAAVAASETDSWVSRWHAAERLRAAQATPRPAEQLRDGTSVCSAKEAQASGLAAQIEALHREINSDQNNAPNAWRGWTKRVQGWLDHRCLQVASQEHGGAFEPLSHEAFVEWWQYGHRWLKSFLALHQGFGNEHRTVQLLPTLRHSVDAASLPNDPMKTLLCAGPNAPCDNISAGWSVRAQQAFRAAERQRRGRLRDRHKLEQRFDDCLKQADILPPAERYASWYRCITPEVGKTVVWPVRTYKAPEDGWLIIAGRRGHYSFCDEIRAYHLASGSAYVAQSCSGLNFSGNGPVDHNATAAASRSGVTSGRVGVEAVREVAWMLLMLRHAKEVGFARLRALQVPGHIHIGRRDRTPLPPMTAPDGGFSSNATTLGWAYLRGGKVAMKGQLVWPSGSNDVVASHALDLLRVAEATLVVGCAAVAGPTKLPLDQLPLGVSILDSAQNTLNSTYQQLLNNYGAAAQRKCGDTKMPLRGGRVRFPKE